MGKHDNYSIIRTDAIIRIDIPSIPQLNVILSLQLPFGIPWVFSVFSLFVELSNQSIFQLVTTESIIQVSWKLNNDGLNFHLFINRMTNVSTHSVFLNSHLSLQMLNVFWGTDECRRRHNLWSHKHRDIWTWQRLWIVMGVT